MAAKTAFEALPTGVSLTVGLEICGSWLEVCGFQVFGSFEMKRGEERRLVADK